MRRRLWLSADFGKLWLGQGISELGSSVMRPIHFGLVSGTHRNRRAWEVHVVRETIPPGDRAPREMLIVDDRAIGSPCYEANALLPAHRIE